GKLDLAISDFNKAIELRPNYALAYFNRGITLQLKGDTMAAIADYNKAIQLSDNVALIEAARQRISDIQRKR
ncbi:MAG: tetratricopeptide repeat protein, partial [Chloroflexi bacterium]|nr:tetratricopeptide repeat protein [Chloroflexota bacterium]